MGIMKQSDKWQGMHYVWKDTLGLSVEVVTIVVSIIKTMKNIIGKKENVYHVVN